MNDWSLGGLLAWFAAAIFVPALLVKLTLGRKGGHRLFDDDPSVKDVRALPLEMTRRRTVWKLKGSAAMLAGLGMALVLYPVACLLGLPINAFGWPREKLIYYTIGVIVLVATLGPAVYRKIRGE